MNLSSTRSGLGVLLATAALSVAGSMFRFMRKYAVAPGMVVKGWSVRLEPTAAQPARFRRDCGARRFAYNWAVTQMGEAFDRGHATGEWDSAIWSAYSLRKRWNQVKAQVAPWWVENSKESYVLGSPMPPGRCGTGKSQGPGSAPGPG